MKIHCHKCPSVYDDAKRSTVCPHNRLPPQLDDASRALSEARQEALDSLDLLTRATRYIAEQFHVSMSLEQAQTNVNLRRDLLLMREAIAAKAEREL